MAQSLLSFDHLNLPQSAAPPVRPSVFYYPSLSLPLCLLMSCFYHCCIRRQSKICQYFTEEYAGQKSFSPGKRFLVVFFFFFMHLCTRDFLFCSFHSGHFHILFHTLVKCIVNLFALKTAALFPSVNQITKTLLIIADRIKLCLSHVWFLVIYTGRILFVSQC